MGTYVTPAQVASEARLGSSGFTSSTSPSDTKAGEIIEEVEAEVESVLKSKYTLPLAVAANSLTVRGIVLAICAARVRRIVNINSSSNGEQNDYQKAEKDARDRLKMILDGTLLLHGETASVTGGSTKSYVSNSDVDPVFQRGVKQW